MFDINDSIQEWRNQMSGTGCCYLKDIEELESHLREETEHLSATGLSEEEGFLVARHRLGEAGALGREFSKINAWAVWRFRIFWMAAGVLALNIFGFVFNLIDFIGVAAVRALRMPNEYLGYSAVVSKIVTIGLAIFTFWFIVRRINSMRQPSFEKENKRAFFMVNAYFNFAWAILLNLLLASLVIYFYPRRPKTLMLSRLTGDF